MIQKNLFFSSHYIPKYNSYKNARDFFTTITKQLNKLLHLSLSNNKYLNRYSYNHNNNLSANINIDDEKIIIIKIIKIKD
jgi:hypothetical protein